MGLLSVPDVRPQVYFFHTYYYIPSEKRFPIFERRPVGRKLVLIAIVVSPTDCLQDQGDHKKLIWQIY